MSGGYQSFAQYYDGLTMNVGYEQQAECFWSILRRYGVKPGLLLDLACGTGSLSVLLAKRGAEVIGVDASGEMLCKAQQKAAEENVSVLFLRQKMQQIDLYGTVDATVCTLDSINHLLRVKDVKETFRRVSLFLNPGGVFLFDVNTVHKHRKTLANNTFVYETPEVFCTWQNEFFPENDIVRITLDFFEREKGIYRRRHEAFEERAYETEQLKGWLKEAGLEPVGCFSGFSQEPAVRTDDRILIAARKPEQADTIKDSE